MNLDKLKQERLDDLNNVSKSEFENLLRFLTDTVNLIYSNIISKDRFINMFLNMRNDDFEDFLIKKGIESVFSANIQNKKDYIYDNLESILKYGLDNSLTFEKIDDNNYIILSKEYYLETLDVYRAVKNQEMMKMIHTDNKVIGRSPIYVEMESVLIFGALNFVNKASLESSFDSKKYEILSAYSKSINNVLLIKEELIKINNLILNNKLFDY